MPSSGITAAAVRSGTAHPYLPTPCSIMTFLTWKTPVPEHSYQIDIRPVPEEEGGGFLATVAELPGCMSTGATEAEARANVQDAITCWHEAAEETPGQPLHEPDRQDV